MTSPTHRHAYIARINRVVDYIDAHIADALDLAALADVAHFSPWHFHRVFAAITGETLADCVRRHRLEAAAISAGHWAGRGLCLGRGFQPRFPRAFRDVTHRLAARRLARMV